MANDAIRAQYGAFFGADFMPLIGNEQAQGTESRVAYAAEFAAFQLGQIDKKLGRLIHLSDRLAKPRGCLGPPMLFCSAALLPPSFATRSSLGSAASAASAVA